MRATLATMAAASVLLAGVLATTGPATAQDSGGQDTPTGSSPADLVGRLVALERELPPLPPSQASDVVLDDTTTWGQLQGDFFAAQTDLALLEDRARQLFIDADDADGPTADAVSAVARSYLEMQQGYGYLADYEGYDLARPVDAADAEGVATGADEAVGLAETGLALLETARERAAAGYDALRNDAAADDAAKSLFDVAYEDTQTFLNNVRPRLHELLSDPTVAVMVVVGRFDPLPDQAHAKDFSVVCIDRADYPVDAPDPQAALMAGLADGTITPSQSTDCPDLPAVNTVTTTAG